MDNETDGVTGLDLGTFVNILIFLENQVTATQFTPLFEELKKQKDPTDGKNLGTIENFLTLFKNQVTAAEFTPLFEELKKQNDPKTGKNLGTIKNLIFLVKNEVKDVAVFKSLSDSDRAKLNSKQDCPMRLGWFLEKKKED